MTPITAPKSILLAIIREDNRNDISGIAALFHDNPEAALDLASRNLRDHLARKPETRKDQLA